MTLGVLFSFVVYNHIDYDYLDENIPIKIIKQNVLEYIKEFTATLPHDVIALYEMTVNYR